MKHALARRCSDCPKRTKAVCRHAFGVFWCIKSCDGEGCAHPLDDVAEAWRKAGWTPDNGKFVPIELSMTNEKRPLAQSNLAFDPPPLTDDDY